MRVHPYSHGFAVTVTSQEVAAFGRSWPCNGFGYGSITFSFDNDGNLVDSNDAVHHPDANGGALVALSQDACRYGSIKLRRPVLTVDGGCPYLAPSEQAALRAFAAEHGKAWKRELAEVYWYNARVWRGPRPQDGHLLHGLRNRLGPRWLADFDLKRGA